MSSNRDRRAGVSGGVRSSAIRTPRVSLRRIARWVRHTRAVRVGWLLHSNRAGLIWQDPIPLSEVTEQACSGHNSFAGAEPSGASRLCQIPSPFTVRLRLVRHSDGAATVECVDGDRSSLMPDALRELVAVSNVKQWRHADRPILQIRTPYTFVSDQCVYLTQTPPFLHYASKRWPGLVFAARFPIDIWPRPLSWGFEWCDAAASLALTRGEPWFYCRFETSHPARAVHLVQAERTGELMNYIEGLSEVTAYVNGTFSLFEAATRRRPKRLLVEHHAPGFRRLV
jgi:hypothetical protein